MPIYELEIAGQSPSRLVKADTPAQARNHVVTAKAISADRMSDLIESGVKLERVSAAAVASAETEAEQPQPVVVDGDPPRDKKGQTPAESAAAVVKSAKDNAN